MMRSWWFKTGLLTAVLLTGACGQAPVAPAVARADQPLVEVLERKPPQYDKRFPVAYKPSQYPVQVIAHRGYSKVAPENTLAAFRAAIEAGADAVELDIHRSADGHLVVMHDWDVERTTDGRGEIEQMTLAQIKRLDAGGWFGPQFKGEQVPTLDEALGVMEGHVTPVIEVKSRDKRIAPLLHETLARHGMLEHAIVTSFFANPIDGLAGLKSPVSLAVLVPPLVSFTNRALDRRASTTQGYYKNMGKKNIELAHSLGLKINAWTVDDPADMKPLVAAGIDGIITNNVSGLHEVLAAHFQPGPRPSADPAPLPAPSLTPAPADPAPPVAAARRR